MRYKVLKAFALHDGRSFHPGDEAELQPADAKPLAKIGWIAPQETKKKENAMKNPVVETRDEPAQS